MTSSPPEAPHYRRNTLTPESPVPLHIPEPANIPVLQNQIDPIFNLMSTHMDQISTTRGMGIVPSEVSQYSISNSTILGPAKLNRTDSGSAREGNHQQGRESDDDDDDGENDYIMALENEDLQEQSEQQNNDTLQNHSFPSTIQPSTTAAIHENLSIPPQNDPTLSFPSQEQKNSEKAIQDSTNPHEPSQTTPITLGQEADVSEHAEKSNIYVQPFDPATDVNDGGVNYQALLDNLSPPTAESLISTTKSTAPETINASRPSSAESPIAAFPIPAGLPPRPPPQDKPAIHPNYTPGEDIRSYHYPLSQTSNSHTSFTSQPSNSYRPSQGYPHPASGATIGANGLPPPPIPTFQQQPPKASQVQRSPVTPQSRHKDGLGRNGERSAAPADEDDDEVPWAQETERKYAEFLHDEAVYVTEGLWDRFPPGSRLFVGNLYTEKVTKRDLFFVFHKYGRLAQISIKNAYGFIQYLDADCCLRALRAEQGQSIRGRKLHLEVSKPQKNARNAAATAAGDTLRAGYARRSRSPDYGRGSSQRGLVQHSNIDRYDRGIAPSTFREEPRRRDDYRPGRSPSPRGFRGRDEYRGRDRSPDRYFGSRRSRSRSPYSRNERYRSRSPRSRDVDEEANLPLLRRDPRDVPDVQMIIVDEVDRTFVAYIEKSFRDRGLRCDTLKLPRVSLAAVVKRQVLEGVQAVVKILRQSQVTGKIPLQVFDRRGGVDNVRFEEYDELDANIAAELVIRAKSTHLAPGSGSGPGPGPYGVAPPYGGPQYSQNPQQIPQQVLQQVPQQPQSAGAQPNFANLITSMDGPALQKLLGAMAQTPQSAQTPQPQTPQQVPDLAALLGNVARQFPPQQGYPYASQQQQHQQQQQQQQQAQANSYSNLASNPSFANNPALSSFLGNRPPEQSMLTQQQQMQPGQQHNVQNIMEQLARYKQ